MVAVGGVVGGGNTSAGGFILIGPFPIVFGTGGNGGELALLSVVLGILMITVLFISAWRFRALTHEGPEETDK